MRGRDERGKKIREKVKGGNNGGGRKERRERN